MYYKKKYLNKFNKSVIDYWFDRAENRSNVGVSTASLDKAFHMKIILGKN